MKRLNRSKRLAPIFISLLLAAAVVGALASVAVAALSAQTEAARPQLAPYPKLSAKQVESISTLFDPSLPFNENVVADAFQDRAGLASTPAAQAALASTVVQTGTAQKGTPPSGLVPPSPSFPQAQSAPQPKTEDASARRREAARASGKFGKSDEASLYGWREVLPLGVVGFDREEGGALVKVREVMLKSTLTGRTFTARKNTAFADATLVEVTGNGVVFRDASGTHEVNWSRSRAKASAAGTPVPPPPPPSRSPAPSGYADTARPFTASRQP